MKRITSIDALRAFALLGILIIHVRQCFGAGAVSYSNKIDYILGGTVKYLFESRFMLIFNILFGVSFYIILNKKDYPARKFVWRCFLLAMLGLLNRFFFSNDVLFKYGFCGMLLVLIRNLSNKKIVILTGILLISGFLLKGLNLGTLTGEIPSRYINEATILSLFKNYSSSLLMLVKQFLNGDFLLIYANMAIGYLMGRIGFINSMDMHIKLKHVLLLFFIYGFIGALYYGCSYLGVHYNPYFRILIVNLFYYSGAAFYWLLFIWLYNHIKWFHKLSVYFEPYGKCGLTNYTMQGFIGVLVCYFLGIGYLGLSFSAVLFFSIVFFVLQALFCLIWLHYFKNGPLEYLWRCATERKWLSLKNK